MKIFATTFLFTLLSVAAFSQNLTVGIKGGTNFSELKGDYTFKESPYYNNCSINSTRFGTFANLKIGKLLSIQTELNYLKNGLQYQIKDKTGGLGFSGNASFGYLQIPLLVQLSYGNRVKVFVNAGPALNILLSDGEHNYTYYDSRIYIRAPEYYPTLPNNLKKDFHRLALSAIGSLGISYNITSRIGILGEFRVEYDLTVSAKNREMINTSDILAPNYNSYQIPLNYDDTHFLNYSVQGGVYFLLGK